MTCPLLRSASPGPVLEAELVPFTNQGKLRVTYNWLYSALNCVPGDGDPFLWVLRKIDEQHVSLSPKNTYRGMTLYASVRDDWDWHVQVQAPHSADWITRVGRDETLTMEGQDLLSASFKGFNGQYVAVNSGLSRHDGHDGYRLQSLNPTDAKARLWFLGVTRVLQDGLDIPLEHQLTADDVAAAFAANGLRPDPGEASRMLAALTG